jgi:hypothetical protein
MVTEATHQVERQRVATADPLRERFFTGPLHEDCGAARDNEVCDEANDVLVVQAAKNLCLRTYPVGVGIVKRDLEHEFLARPFTLDEEDIGAAATPEPTLDDEATIE